MSASLLRLLALLPLALLAGQCSSPDGVCSGRRLTVHHGMLDLSQWDWECGHAVRLDGDWEFCPGCLLQSEPRQCACPVGEQRFSGVPDKWERMTAEGRRMGPYERATYRLRVRLPRAQCDLAVAMHQPPSAYRLWANGVLAGSEGVLGTDARTHEPTWNPRVISLPECSDTLELVAEVAAFDHPARGFGPLVLGEFRHLQRQRHRALIFRGMILGCVIAVAVYYLVLVALGKCAREYIFIGITCLAAGANLTVYFENLLVLVAPVPFWAYYYLFWVTTPLTVFSLFLFSRALFPEEFPRWSIGALAAYIVAAWAPALSPGLARRGYYAFVGHMDLYVMTTATVLGVSALVVAAWRRKTGAGLFVLGVVFIASFGLYDYFQNVYGTSDLKLYPLGLLAFVLCQAAGLARSFTAAEMAARRHREQLAQTETLAALGTVTAMVAHEVSNPNNAILLAARSQEQMWSGILRVLDAKLEAGGDFAIGECTYSELRPDLEELPRRIARNSNRIKDIVDSLRVSVHPASRSMAPVQLNDIVRSALTVVEFTIRQCTRAFTVEYGRDLPRVQGSATALEQVVVNLVRNACQALRRPTDAVVVGTSASESGDQVVLTVRDEGRGMDGATRADLFTPFSTTKPPSEGTGLGMAVTLGIVQQHGGRIEVDTMPERGTTVRVFLPAIAR